MGKGAAGPAETGVPQNQNSRKGGGWVYIRNLGKESEGAFLLDELTEGECCSRRLILG